MENINDPHNIIGIADILADDDEDLDIEKHPSEFDKLRKLLAGHLSRSSEKTVEHKQAYTPEEEEALRRRLTSLGYM